jgi:hypothetical protein
VKIAWGAALLAAIACSEKPKHKRPAPAPAPEAQEASAVPAAAPSYVDDEDPKWIQGTWKEDGKESWLLFNPGGEVIELGGKPVHGLRKGKLSLHGKYVGVLFETEALSLETSPDKSELASSDIRRVYRRGAPP